MLIQGGLSMAFRPKEAPVYGGGILQLNLEDEAERKEEDAVPQVAEEEELYLVLQGRGQTHVAIMKHSHDMVWRAPIPGHEAAERVRLSVVQLSPAEEQAVTIAVGEFSYHYDSAYFLAHFLVNSVNNPNALDDLELIRSDNFDLANELLSTLDSRLSGALRHIPFPEGWHMLGSDDYESSDSDCRETLLHLAARLGLHNTALFLLSKPGSEEALCSMNRDGQLPCAVATHNGFDDIAELFSGYNTNGMVTQLDEQLDTDFGIICNHGSAGLSLTTLPEGAQNRSIETLIEALREMEATMKRGRSPGLRRQYQTDWPSPPLPHRQMPTDHPYDAQESSTELQVAETMERILQEQKAHGDTISHMMQGYLNSDGQPSSGSRLQISSEIVKEASRQYGILEGSLSSARGINQGLLRLRGNQLLQRRQAEQQHVRRLGLSRFSTSCPSLDAEHIHCPLSPIHEGDQHKSMLDLATEVGHPSLADQSSPFTFNDSFLGNPCADSDGTVRICVNGVTVDSSEDFPRQGAEGEDGSVRLRRTGCLASPAREDDVRRRSWCPDSPRVYGVVGGRAGEGTAALQNRALAMTGKSLSLSGLDCEEEESDEDAQQPTSIPQYRASPQREPMSMVSQHRASLDASDERALSGGSRSPEEDYSPADSDGSGSAVKDTIDGPEEMRQHHSEMMAVSPQVAHSMNDLSSSQMTNGEKKTHPRSIGGIQGVRSYEDEQGMLVVGHSKIIKSQSTPSIPAATQGRLADDQKVRDIRREGKQFSEPSQLLYLKLVEDYDPKFRRQDEIEEVEEDGTSGEREMSLKEFRKEDPNAGDSDEKSKSAVFRKEEKKRKPSMFTRFSYRNKKHKDKESSKVKHSHHFLAASISNATTCDVCHKPMANKPALRCENCLINVHEHNCKDQVPLCDKYTNMKVHREGSAPAATGQDRSLSQGTSLRPSNSFKLKDRSASAPVKRESGGSMPFVPHRHSVPSTGYVGSPPPGTTYLQWFQATSRFSVVDKAITETEETDGGNMGGMDMGPSNIAETISESLESLDTVVTAESVVLEEEPDLMLGVEEPEAWNITVDRKTLKKMNAKDIKRQDTIWELIQTEKQYVRKLKIMQKLFRDPLLSEMDVTMEQIDRLFPRLDELVEVHTTFLRSLLALQGQNPDRSVDEIGPTLVDQFSGKKAERMKLVYGTFCSRHTEAIHLYKDFVKTEKKFQNFCRKISNLSICEKRELPDFILGVTVRLAKYHILIEAIFKSTKDKKDREQLSQALQCSKEVVHAVDAQVASYEKLMEVYRAFDSRTTVYVGKKFKRQDLIARGRYLVHAGSIGWKTARSRVLDTYTLVLNDLLVFLQKNEQKYTFFTQDNKSCVVPLYKLLVREKRDERDSHGIYVISQTKSRPEMYELVCRTRDEREQWMKILQEAIKNCVVEADEFQQEQQQQQPEALIEEERRKQEEKSRKMKDIINQLHQKDDVIKSLCEQKNDLMLELLEVSTVREEGGSRPSLQHDVGSTTSVEVLQAAIEEASRLTTIIQGNGNQLSRSVSSAGEHVSTSYVNMFMPKRAETFAGFDTPSDVPKSGALVKKRFNQQYGDEEGRCPSDLSLHGTDTIPEDSVISTDSYYSSQPGLSPQSLPSISSPHQSSPQGWEGRSSGEGEVQGLDTSDHGSMGELSSSSVTSLVQPLGQPSSAEQMMSVVQLVKYLHNLMNLTAKQTTTVECLRAELAEAKEEISKLSQNMHGHRRLGCQHNQLEELRNLQENISRERQEWEREKERERVLIQQERGKLEMQRKQLEKHEHDLRSKKDDLRREKETLQRQIDMLNEQGLLGTATLTDPGHIVHTVDLDAPDAEYADSSDRSVPGHRRSVSADFFHGAPPSQAELDALSETRGMPRRPRHSVSSLQNYNGSREKQNIPEHLMSTRNEQRMGGSNVQKLPMKLSSGAAGGHQGHKSQAPLPPPHSRTSSLSSLGARHGGSNPSFLTPTPQQAQGMITRNQNTRSAPSNLAMVMKLAEPGKGRGGGSGQSGSGGVPSGPAHPGSGHPAPGGPAPPPAPGSGAAKPSPDSDPNRVIYF